MKTNSPNKKRGLNMRPTLRCMMEDGYYPSFEGTHIQFETEGNIAIVDCEEEVLSVRLFFSIDEDSYDLFLEASNLTMLETRLVKPAVLMDMKNIMFSCELVCHNAREFRKIFPVAVEHLNDAFKTHRMEMKRLMHAAELASTTIPAAENTTTGTGRKILS